MSDLIVGSLTTAFGGLLGYWLGHLKEARERRERRTVLASALLVELRALNGVLRQVAGGGVPYGDPFHHPVLEATLGELSLFERETAVALTHFRNLLLDAQHDVRAAHRAQSGDMGPQMFYVLNDSVKVKATYAANAIRDVKAALLKSGGQLPPPIRERPATREAPPQLLPSPFELFEDPEAGDE